MQPVRTALLSVSDKTDIIAFANALSKMGIRIISTGGTAKVLREANLTVTEVSDLTHFPEILNGRVKTLHPHIHAGILARRGVDDKTLLALEITPIDLVVVNLYPFKAVIANQDCDFSEAIEHIDIGGPCLLRAAAKNHAHVGAVVSSDDYHQVLDELRSHGALSDALRLHLAYKAFSHTAHYDNAIACYLTRNNDFPEIVNYQFHKKMDLRYGENPHQRAAFYQILPPTPGTLANFLQHQGKPLSFNNLADGNAALSCVKEFSKPACVIVKHLNPCGVAEMSDQLAAYQMAYRTDPTSSFGGIIAFNTELTAKTLEYIINQQFVEMIIAPSIAADALQVARQKDKLRILTVDQWTRPQESLNITQVEQGILVQSSNIITYDETQLIVVTEKQPSQEQFSDCLFAWKVVKHTKSNAIVYAREHATLGIGAGQMSRIDSAKLAKYKATEESLSVAGSVMASDAFFPFSDSIELAAESGIEAIIQPGGSIRDDEVIDAANSKGIAMVFTGIRHFKH